MKKIFVMGVWVAVFLTVALSGQFFCFAAGDETGQMERVQKLQPQIISDLEYMEKSVSSKIRQKTGKEEVIVEINKLIGTPHRIIGGGLEITPQDKQKIKGSIVKLESVTISKEERKTRKKEDDLSDDQKVLDEAARNFVKANQDILQADESNLKLSRIQKVKNKAYINYQQYYKNILVYGAVVSVILNEEGKIPSCGSDYHKDINVNTTPAIAETQAQDIAKEDAKFNTQEDNLIMDELLILPVNENNTYKYYLSYKLAVSKCNPPACWVYFIAADTGEILVKYNDLKNETLSGNITGQMLPEYSTDSFQTVPFRDEFVDVPEQSLSTITDTSGNYVFSLDAGVYTLSVPLKGPWVKMITGTGRGTETVYTMPVTVPGAYNLIWDSSSMATAAETNTFYHVNKIYDYVKNTLEYDGMDWQIRAWVNIQGMANAYWNPAWGQIGFGDGGGAFENFALFSDVIYHEYTHATTDTLYEAGGVDLPYEGESGAIDEGLADYFGCTINGDSKVGEVLMGEEGLRDLDNTLMYPDDLTGEVHDDGRIIGGALWDLRENLINSYGEAEGKALADDLIHNARFSYPGKFTDYETSILIADDDNGDIFDGTPHDVQITNAFKGHGINGYLLCSITSPAEGNYIQGAVEIIGSCYSVVDNLQSYEISCWREENPVEKYIIMSSPLSSNIAGQLAVWDTTAFAEGIYSLELKITAEDGEESSAIRNNITIDNVNNPPIKPLYTEVVIFTGKNNHFTIAAGNIDNPATPWGQLTYTITDLPVGAAIDPETGLFSWNFPPAGTFSMTLVVSDCDYSITQNLVIYVTALKNLTVLSGKYEAQGQNPGIDGDKIVWHSLWMAGYRLIQEGIDIYDAATNTIGTVYSTPPKPRMITIGECAQIHNNRVVWDEYWGSKNDIYMRDIGTGTKSTICAAANYQTDPDVYGDIVVWQDYRNGNWDVYMYDILENQETSVCIDAGSVSEPRIYERKIVWNDSRNDDWDVYMYDIFTGEEQIICGAEGHQYFASIYENIVVWEDKRSGNWDIYLYDIPAGQETAVCVTDGDQQHPEIYKNVLVWTDERSSLYLYDIARKRYIYIPNGEDMERWTPVVSKNNVAWTDVLTDGKMYVMLTILPDDVFPEDPIPPTTPAVTDGGDYTSYANQLSASWTADDPESGIMEYQYAIGSTTPGGTDIVNWTSTGMANTVIKTGLSLQNGTVYYFGVKAKNGSDMWSETGCSDGIMVDIIAPTGTISINNGAAYTTSRYVTLNLSAADSGSGMGTGALMKFSNDQISWSPTEPYNTTKSWTLTSGDGTKTVYVQFQDGAGNWSNAVSDTIVLDTTPPTGTISINNNAAYTASRYVTLNLSATDSGSGVSKMKFSNNNITWSAEENYAATKSWTLTSANGTKTVYAKFKDGAGNWTTAFITDTIILDTTAPVISHTPITSAPRNQAITFTATVTDTGSGVNAVTLKWRKRILRLWGWEWSELRTEPMVLQGYNIYRVTLTASQVEDRRIKYYIKATDNVGMTNTTPEYIIERY